MKYLIILLLFVFSSSYSQKCEYLVNKVSGMDGSLLIITQPVILSEDFEDGLVKVWSTIYGDTSLIVAFVFEMKEELALSKGDSIIAILDNEELIGLELIQNSVSKDGESGKITTAMTALDQSVIELLQTHKLSEIKLTQAGMNMAGEIEKKSEATAIQKVINCVFRHLK